MQLRRNVCEMQHTYTDGAHLQCPDLHIREGALSNGSRCLSVCLSVALACLDNGKAGSPKLARWMPIRVTRELI